MKFSKITTVAKENLKVRADHTQTDLGWAPGSRLSGQQPHTYLLGLLSPLILRSFSAFCSSACASATCAFFVSICEEANACTAASIPTQTYPEDFHPQVLAQHSLEGGGGGRL